MSAKSFARRLRLDNQALLLLASTLLPAALVAFSMIAQSAVAESFCAVIAFSIALPPLLAAQQGPAMRTLVAALATTLTALLMLAMPVSLSQWIDVVAITGSVAMLLAGTVAFVPSSLITLMMLLWLSWPIWLSGRLSGHERLVNLLTAAHPLLAINGILLDQAIWIERPLMYGWTGLNQDVPVTIPTTPAWCVLLHAGVGMMLLMISVARTLRERRRANAHALLE